jgi:hypothetical protein
VLVAHDLHGDADLRSGSRASPGSVPDPAA